MTTISATAGTHLILIDYAQNNLDWARLYDHRVLGWIVDETGSPPSAPIPVILARQPAAPVTAPIVSPRWAAVIDTMVVVPMVWRGTMLEFFTWLATNNGAQRQLESCLGVDIQILNTFNTWAAANPGLVAPTDPTAAPVL